MLMSTVAGWNNQLALRTIQMAAPVRNEAITAHGFGVIRIASFATVSYDGMIGDPWLNWNRVDDFHETIVRRKGINTVWEYWEQLATLAVRRIASSPNDLERANFKMKKRPWFKINA